MKRAWQQILVVRECSTSFTSTLIIHGETASSLKDGLVSLCTSLRLLDAPPAIIRCDPATGFQALVNDPWLAENRLQVEIGEHKNVNKNPVAERAIEELREELCKIDPLNQPVTPAQVAVATARVNAKVCHPESICFNVISLMASRFLCLINVFLTNSTIVDQKIICPVSNPSHWEANPSQPLPSQWEIWYTSTLIGTSLRLEAVTWLLQ